MVGAGNGLLTSAPLHQLMGPVTAYVIKGPDHIVLTAYEDKTFAQDLQGEIAAGLGQLAGVTRKQPGAEENPLLFQLPYAVVQVVLSGQS